MTFDWESAIERNFEAIERIVAGLYALAGITSLRPFVDTLPRHLRIRILSVLRPAEFAARRLIAMAACTRGFALPAVREGKVPPVCGKPAGAKPEPSGGDSCRTAAFRLFDPLKRYAEPWLTPEEIAALGGPHASPCAAPAFPPDEAVDARALCRRIAALRHALEDLDGFARRLARWRARRHLETCRPKRWMPMRPGRPPGWAKRPKTAIAEVLNECHFLALDAWAGPDPP